MVNTHYLAGAMESELEINIYLQEDISREQALNLKTNFEGINGCAELVFVSKEEGLKALEDRFGKETSLLQAMG